MVAAVGCLLVALACQDVDRIAAPPKAPAAMRAPASPPVLFKLTCTIRRAASTISCAPGAPERAAGVRANVIVSVTGTYALFVPYGLEKDTVNQVWSFSAFVHNQLQQSIGTLDGTTATGSKVFVTAIYATQGTGTVSIINKDGVDNFTAPNQPYFKYNAIVPAGANSTARLWRVSVPNTVTAVNMDILMSTDFPAEQTVTLLPPDTTPAWVHADTNVATGTDSTGGNFFKHIVKVSFRPTATLADRQLAVGLVNGVVVGGEHSADGAVGFYYVKVADDGSGMGIFSAIQALTALPQVESAIFELNLQPAYLRPSDGGDYNKWKLSPDSADLSKKNWSLEMIDAPFAWGCSNGSSSTLIGIEDAGFHPIGDLGPNFNTSSDAFSFSADTNQHGTFTSSILAAAGNNQTGMTGVMWKANVIAPDPAVDTVFHTNAKAFVPFEFGKHTVSLAAAGARVVNISFGVGYTKVVNGVVVAYRPGTQKRDSAKVKGLVEDFMRGVRQEQHDLHTSRIPLIVVAADNFPYSGNHHQDDAWWGGMAQLKDSLHDTVIVVGASDPHRHVAWFSGANINHAYVDIMAPGDSIYALDKNGALKLESGTSVAAPLVTGAVGLLISFDSMLGSFSPGHGAPELKSLILAGADSNIDVHGALRTADGYRLLNLYTPLVQAAQRSGAPLCGNRVWGDSGKVYAQRNSTTTEALFSTTEAAGELDVMHGGHRIHLLGKTNLDDRDSC